MSSCLQWAAYLSGGLNGHGTRNRNETIVHTCLGLGARVHLVTVCPGLPLILLIRGKPTGESVLVLLVLPAPHQSSHGVARKATPFAFTACYQKTYALKFTEERHIVMASS